MVLSVNHHRTGYGAEVVRASQKQVQSPMGSDVWSQAARSSLCGRVCGSNRRKMQHKYVDLDEPNLNFPTPT